MEPVIPMNRRVRWIMFGYPLYIFIWLAWGPCAGITSAQDHPEKTLYDHHILILNGYEFNTPSSHRFNQGFSAVLQSSGAGTINQHYDSLGLGHNSGLEYRKLKMQAVSLRHRKCKIDLIITLHTEGFKFLLDMGPSFFPAAPVIALMLPQGFKLPETDRRIIPHIIIPDLNGTLEIGLKLVPKADRVYVVNGTHPMDRWLEKIARRDFKKREGRLDFYYLSDLPLEKILATVSTAPASSIVYLTTFSQDAAGEYWRTTEVSRELAKVSTAPVFGFLGTVLGNGSVGGSLISFKYIGTKAGELVLDILGGAQNTGNIPAELKVPQVDMFDWRQLKHWDLSESDLPRGSVIINREFSLWDLKYYFIGILVFIMAQSLLIAGLLVQKRRRKSAEASLTRSEKKYRDLFESALEGIYESSPQGQVLTANPALARKLGYDSPEEVTSSINDIANQIWANPDERTDYVRLLDKQNVIRGFECQFFHKDGTKFWVSLNTRRVTGPDDQTLLYSGFLEDITKRKQAEDALSERLMFEAMLSDISAGFINQPVDQIDSMIQDTQHRVCEFLGLDLSALWQLSAENPSLLYQTHVYRPLGGPPIPERMEAQEYFPWCLQQVTAGKIIAISTESAPAEAARDKEAWQHFGIKSSLTFPLSVGGEFLIGALSFAAMREERTWPEPIVKQLQLLAQVFANALERKRSEEVLRESEARLSLATNASGAGLWIMEFDTNEVWVSKKTRDLFQFSPDETVTYERFFDTIHPDDHEQVHQAVQQTLQAGATLKVDFRVELSDGSTRWVGAHGQPYPSTNPVRLIGVSLDMTERIRAEAEARQHREVLAHMTRVATMGELTGSLAHEINQPLTAILSNAEAARRFLTWAAPDINEVRQILDDIIQNSKRAGEVVQKVRSLLRKEEPQYKLLDLNRAIQEVIGLIREESVLSGLIISLELVTDPKMVLGDRNELQQVVLNLTLNSAAAMKKSLEAQRKINIRTVMPDSRSVRVSVTDSGTGIDESAVESLFEPFYTTKSDGLGLGLSISQRIIKDHGGTMEVWNNPAGGATFAFLLPAHQGEPPQWR
jgi:PAS domain S-box-containing protein